MGNEASSCAGQSHRAALNGSIACQIRRCLGASGLGRAPWRQCGAIAQTQSAGMRAAAMDSANGASAWADT